MSHLATLLHADGLLNERQVEAADQYALRQGTTFADALLALDFVDERALRSLIESKLVIPGVEDAELMAVPATLSDRVRPEIAWRHCLLPIAADAQGSLTVAMVDPTDSAAVDLVATESKARIVRSVALASALRRALTRTYGPNPLAPRTPAGETGEPQGQSTRRTGPHARVPPEEPRKPAAARGRRNSQAVRARAPGVPTDQGNAAAQQAGPPTQGKSSQASSNAVQSQVEQARTNQPGQARAGAVKAEGQRPNRTPETAQRPNQSSSGRAAPGSGNVGVMPLSDAAFEQVLPRIREASGRDELTDLLLDFLSGGFDRVLLFVHSRGELRGHDSRGSDLNVEAVRQVRIPSSMPSLFSTVIAHRSPYFGPMAGGSDIDRALASALDGLPGQVLMFPVQLGERTPLVVFAHAPRCTINPTSIADLANAVGSSLQRVIAQTRSSAQA